MLLQFHIEKSVNFLLVDHYKLINETYYLNTIEY